MGDTNLRRASPGMWTKIHECHSGGEMSKLQHHKQFWWISKMVSIITHMPRVIYTHQQHTRTTQARPSTLWPPNNPAFTWLSTPVPTAIADRKISQKKRCFCFCTKSAMVNVGGCSEFYSEPFKSLNFGRRFSSQLLMIADACGNCTGKKHAVWQQDQGCQAPTTTWKRSRFHGHNSRWVGEKRSTKAAPLRMMLLLGGSPWQCFSSSSCLPMGGHDFASWNPRCDWPVMPTSGGPLGLSEKKAMAPKLPLKIRRCFNEKMMIDQWI